MFFAIRQNVDHRFFSSSPQSCTRVASVVSFRRFVWTWSHMYKSATYKLGLKRAHSLSKLCGSGEGSFTLISPKPRRNPFTYISGEPLNMRSDNQIHCRCQCDLVGYIFFWPQLAICDCWSPSCFLIDKQNRIRFSKSAWKCMLFRSQRSGQLQRYVIDNCSQKVKIEAHGAHKCHSVASFSVREVLSTPKTHKKFHGHTVKPVGTR